MIVCRRFDWLRGGSLRSFSQESCFKVDVLGLNVQSLVRHLFKMFLVSLSIFLVSTWNIIYISIRCCSSRYLWQVLECWSPCRAIFQLSWWRAEFPGSRHPNSGWAAQSRPTEAYTSAILEEPPFRRCEGQSVSSTLRNRWFWFRVNCTGSSLNFEPRQCFPTWYHDAGCWGHAGSWGQTSAAS